jgi:hypothetical protein
MRVSPSAFCADPGRQHPVGSRIAEGYGVDYGTVMNWFCNGHYGFGQILLALQTSKLAERRVLELLFE